MISRRTIRNGAIGAVLGTALGFVPLVLLIAPIVGGVAGYLERDGVKPGAVAEGVAGLLMAALTTLVTGTVLFVRFGDLSFASPDVLHRHARRGRTDRHRRPVRRRTAARPGGRPD